MKITLKRSTRQELEKKIVKYSYLNKYKQVIRYRTIILISDSYQIEDLATIYGKTSRMIYKWLELFLTKGVKGLKYKKKEGRKSKLTKVEKEHLKELIIKGSIENGFKSSLWTSSMIQELIIREFDVEYALGYIPMLLKSLSLSHKKIETISHKASEKKQEEWENEKFIELTKKVIKEKGKLLFEDESTFLMWSQKGYSWGEKGEKLEVKVNMSSEYKKVFGAIDIETGKFYYQIRKKGNGDIFLDYLRYLVKEFKGVKIFLVLDNGRIHKNKNVLKYLEKNKTKVELNFLPPYSPKFNPIEKVWKMIKQNSMHGRFFVNNKEFSNHLEQALTLASTNTYHVISLMSKWSNIFNFIKNELISKNNRWTHICSLFDKAFA